MKSLTAVLYSVLLVLSAVFVSAQANEMPVAIMQAEIDNTDIEPFGVNKLDIERAQEFSLKFELMSNESAKDIEIRAFISGYEYNDVNDISDHIGPFDFDANVTYVKKMKLSLPDDLDVDDYQLRVILSNRNGEETVYNYLLSVNTMRHNLKIEDVVLSPGSSVTAGQALLASVRLENMGQKDAKDVKVVVSIPSLAVSATEYVDEIESGDEEETEELFLKLPRCADAGVYTVNVDVMYNDGRDKASDSVQVNVLENDACNEVSAPVVVQQPEQNASVVAKVEPSSNVRAALEVILLVLVALLVIVGLIIGFSRMRED